MPAATRNNASPTQSAPDSQALDAIIQEGRGRARAVIRDWNLKHAYINGVWRPADSRETLDVLDPAKGDVIGAVPFMRTS